MEEEVGKRFERLSETSGHLGSREHFKKTASQPMGFLLLKSGIKIAKNF